MKPNAKRRAMMHTRNYGVDGRRGEAVRAMRCITQSSDWGRRYLKCPPPIHASHVTARGRGGVNGDARSLVPHCRHCHDWWSRKPWDYTAKTGLDLHAEARRIAADLDARFGAEPCYLCGETEGHAFLCKTLISAGTRRPELRSVPVSGEAIPATPRDRDASRLERSRGFSDDEETT